MHRHRVRPNRSEYFSSRESIRPPRRKAIDRIIGIDGEGIGRSPHIYTLLAAADEDANEWVARNPSGLSTVQCLDLILSLPNRSLVFGYAFQYDLTKILADLPDDSLYLLYHEKFRANVKGNRVLYAPVLWEGYRINYINRRFTVSRGPKTVTVWDIFRFFNTKFTTALADWKVGTDESRLEIGGMKDRRSVFDTVNQGAIERYCVAECVHLAHLGRSLLSAHSDAGIPLSSYYGAGSTASVMLRNLGVADKRGEIPGAMLRPIACAFFGGRFENSIIGSVPGPVYSYDISSAYPYHATGLPCLEHGKWTKARRPSSLDVDRASLALCHWSASSFDVNGSWGSYPVRSVDGTIVFPLSGRGGWTWREEFISGQQLAPSVVCDVAWLYHTDCGCNPFASLATVYRERIRIGKEGKGIALKLGMNSVYGKLAQSQGINPPFQSWVWAGNITSGCRSQLLDAIALSNDPWDVLMLATDSITCRNPLKMPRPRKTGTDDLLKPLGGWEEKIYRRGIFAVRPGIYFPLQPTEEEISEVRARGFGRKTLYDQWRQVVDAFNARKPSIQITGMTRFVGAKSALTRGSKSPPKRNSAYGEWVSHFIDVSFAPQPKRQSVGPNNRLEPWKYLDWESVPYDPAMQSPESILLSAAQQIAEEQPNVDLDEAETST